MENIILRGFYRPKGNLNNSEIDGLIEIVGESPNLKNHFIIKNKQNLISEYDLRENYVYFGPGAKPSDKQKIHNKFIKNNLGDFSKLNNSVNNTNDDNMINDTDNVSDENIVVENNVVENNVVENEIKLPSYKPPKVKPINEKELIKKSLINKIKQKTKLTNPVQQKINITISYDLEKVIMQAEFLDIDKNEVLKELIDFNNITFENEIIEEKVVVKGKVVEKVEEKADEKLLDALKTVENLRKKIANDN